VREMSVHLEEHDLAGSRDDRHRAIGVPEVVLLLVQVDADDAVDLPRGAGRDEVPHRYPGVGEGHARGGQAGAPRPGIGSADLNEDIDRGPRELFLEHDGRERLRDYLRDLDGPSIRPRSLPVGDTEGRHVVSALDERPGGVLQVTRVGLPRSVDRKSVVYGRSVAIVYAQ